MKFNSGEKISILIDERVSRRQASDDIIASFEDTADYNRVNPVIGDDDVSSRLLNFRPFLFGRQSPVNFLQYFYFPTLKCLNLVNVSEGERSRCAAFLRYSSAEFESIADSARAAISRDCLLF